MNKTDLETLAAIRLQEAQVLLSAEYYPGAYYLAGYALECALKACIAKQIKAFDFPDKELAFKCYTHDLSKLLVTAGLKELLAQREKVDSAFKFSWAIAKLWSEEARYRTDIDKQSATELLDAIVNEQSGIYPWLKNYL